MKDVEIGGHHIIPSTSSMQGYIDGLQMAFREDPCLVCVLWRIEEIQN